MRLADIDWTDVWRRAAVWERLSPGSREAFLQWKSGADPAVSRFGDDLDMLIQERFVTVPKGASTARKHPAARDFVWLARSMFRHRSIWNGSDPALFEYVRDHTTRIERDNLLSAVDVYRATDSQLAGYVASTDWLDRFLDGPIPHAPRSPRAYAHEAAREVVRELAAADEPVPFRELPDRFAAMSAERLSAALRTAVGQLVLFPAFTPDDLDPVITLWPRVLERLHGTPPAPPEPFQPDVSFSRPFLFEDMVALLVAASAEPPRFRQADGYLYVRDHERLAAELQPLSDDARLDGVLEELDDCDPEPRVYRAIATLDRLGLLCWATRGRSNVREPTAQARAWMALPAIERLRAVLEPVREEVAACRTGAGDGPDAPRLPGPSSSSEPRLSIAPSRAIDLRGYPDPALVAGLAEAFAALPDDGVVSLDGFLRYHGSRGVEALSNVRLFRFAWTFGVSRVATPEQRERVWIEILIETALERLVPFGALRVATHEDDLAIGLTPIGRYLFGLIDELEYSAPAEAAAAVVVQPDFEIVLTGRSPLAEAEIARFAERIGSGVGAVFRITRGSVFTAAAAGLTAGDILGTLRAHAGELPANVEREIAGWVERCRRVTLRTAVLVECPDEETAARVAAAAGDRARRVGPEVVELVDTRGRPALERKLAAAGIVVDEEREEPDDAW